MIGVYEVLSFGLGSFFLLLVRIAVLFQLLLRIGFQQPVKLHSIRIDPSQSGGEVPTIIMLCIISLVIIIRT